MAERLSGATTLVRLGLATPADPGTGAALPYRASIFLGAPIWTDEHGDLLWETRR